MFGRVFWFAVGAGVTIYVVVKARDYIDKHSPEALVERVQQSVVDAGDATNGIATYQQQFGFDSVRTIGANVQFRF